MGTNRKHKENTGFALEPTENERKTHVLHFDLFKNKIENVGFALELMETN